MQIDKKDNIIEQVKKFTNVYYSGCAKAYVHSFGYAQQPKHETSFMSTTDTWIKKMWHMHTIDTIQP